MVTHVIRLCDKNLLLYLVQSPLQRMIKPKRRWKRPSKDRKWSIWYDSSQCM